MTYFVCTTALCESFEVQFHDEHHRFVGLTRHRDLRE